MLYISDAIKIGPVNHPSIAYICNFWHLNQFKCYQRSVPNPEIPNNVQLLFSLREVQELVQAFSDRLTISLQCDHDKAPLTAVFENLETRSFWLTEVPEFPFWSTDVVQRVS
jgi:hypothetical protein